MGSKICAAINKEKTVSVRSDADGQILGLGFGRNRGQVAEVIVFAAVGDGFQIFRVALMGDAHTSNLTLFCHVYSLLLFHNGIVGKLILGNPAAFLHKTDDALCVGISCGI